MMYVIYYNSRFGNHKYAYIQVESSSAYVNSLGFVMLVLNLTMLKLEYSIEGAVS